MVGQTFTGARSRSQSELERLGLNVQQAEYYQALAGAMLYGHPGLRAAPEILARAAEGQNGTGAIARPLAVLHTENDPESLPPHSPYAQLVTARRYWQSLGLPLDLMVIANGRHGRTLLSPEDIDRLDASARMVVTTDLPDLISLQQSLQQRVQVSPIPRSLPPPADQRGEQAATGSEKSADEIGDSAAVAEELTYFNDHGGFTTDGREYVIRLATAETRAWSEIVADGGPYAGYTIRFEPETIPPAHTPQPWINVIANENFGCLVSETGAGYTWHGNSREHRLTPWSNDPVLDPPGEALYVRDENTGRFWSPLPGPVTRAAPYEMRHGFGYSRCRHISHDLVQETTIFVHRHDPVKYTVVRLTNRSDQKRSLSIISYFQLVLGGDPQDSARFVVTSTGMEDGSLLARNLFATDHADSVAFTAVTLPAGARVAGVTGDRAAFIGPGGDLGRPAAVTASEVLDGRVGAGLDPCFAQQISLELAAGQEVEIVFLLGEADSLVEAHDLVTRHSRSGAAEASAESPAAQALGEVRRYWQDRLSALQISTPSPPLDLMVNGWLPYQTLSCRIWGRSAFYQSGGAFGFRDQLQDAGALIYQWPELTRAQILLHAAHQFREGDVLHWWHPPRSQGLRTRFADDLLWLPFLTCFYLRVSGDHGILDESTPYLAAPLLAAGEDEVFLQPEDSGEVASLYDHCCRAIDRSLDTGRHGLPLFGTGDWNDGMNRVGREGRGESVWMGFFLTTILDDFIPVCERRRDSERVGRYFDHRRKLQAALNEHGWDGQWYRRGYYDNGQPLGSQESDECQIDALAQAWSVLSGVAPADRAAQAVQAVEKRLVSTDDKLIRLLTPPFADTPNDPGYIKGYVAGVRENGGQYTHAALWFVQAMAQLGRNDRVAALLDLLNPVNHARTAEQVSVYQVEPYVVAADVYGAPPHVGRGGWTWYTGSSGWMHRVVLESLLGFQISGGKTLVMNPCVPDDWPRFAIDYRLPGEETRYKIRVENPQGRAQAVINATCDGETVPCTDGVCRVPLRRDGQAHRVELILGPREGRR
jgi:cyclic beta-1,2-glucan synthetase